MKRCSNAHKGCNGTTSSYKIHFCGDCYRAWNHGGEAAVAADIASRSAPKHECVGQARLDEKEAECQRLAQQVTHLQAEVHDMRAVADFAVAVTAAVAPCFRPGTLPTAEAKLELIKRRCVGIRADRPAGFPHPSARKQARPERDLQLDRIEGKLSQIKPRHFWPCLWAAACGAAVAAWWLV